jgi:hypothetical protein
VSEYAQRTEELAPRVSFDNQTVTIAGTAVNSLDELERLRNEASEEKAYWTDKLDDINTAMEALHSALNVINGPKGISTGQINKRG